MSRKNFQVQVAKAINHEYASTNCVYYKSISNGSHSVPPECYIKFTKSDFVKKAKQLSDVATMQDNFVYLNNEDRNFLNASLLEKFDITIIPKPSVAKSVYVSIMMKDKKKQISDVTDLMDATIKSIMTDTIVNAEAWLMFYAPELCYANILTVTNANSEDKPYAYVDASTEIVIVNTEKKTLKLNISSINFEKIGVGGLEKQFKELFQSIFMTRILPEKIFKKIGIKHNKGVILYGPPGCGKTRLARQIGEIIGCKSIRIINGPELISKWYGESEKNIRECFDVARKDPEGLHILVFDEFDSIAVKRGGGSDSQHNDRVVGQILTMMDGVDEINYLIVFALTNRKDMIDPAMLRPGRFSLHLKIELPNLQGR